MLNRSVLSGLFSSFLSTSTSASSSFTSIAAQNIIKSDTQYAKNTTEKPSSSFTSSLLLSEKRASLIPDKVPVPIVPSLSIIVKAPQSSEKTKENDSNDDNDNSRSNNNNKYNNIDNNNYNNNFINSMTSSPRIPNPLPLPLPLPLPTLPSSLSAIFDSTECRSNYEYSSSGSVSRCSSSGSIHRNWTEVNDSPGINYKRQNLYENNNEYGYENKNENDDVKEKMEDKEQNIIKEEKKVKKEKERVKKNEMRIDNWMESSVDKNHYEKRNKEFYNDIVYKNKEKEKEEAKIKETEKQVEREKENEKNGKYGNSLIISKLNRVCDILPKPVVLYYCSVLIAGVPGMIYITQTLLCFSSLTTKECFYLRNLNSVKIIEKNDKKEKKSPNLFSSLLSLPSSSARYPILFSFFSGLKEITVVPLTISSDQLQSVIIEIKNTFITTFSIEKT